MSSPPLDTVVRNRRLGFLIWQSIPSTLIFLLFKIFILSPLSTSTSTSTTHSILAGLFKFLLFQFSQLGFSFSLAIVSSPQPNRPASPIQLALGLFSSWSLDFRRRAMLSLSLLLFVTTAAVSGFLSIMSFCWENDFERVDLIWRVGFRGFLCGLIYSVFFVYKQRWVSEFPIIQVNLFIAFILLIMYI